MTKANVRFEGGNLFMVMQILATCGMNMGCISFTRMVLSHGKWIIELRVPDNVKQKLDTFHQTSIQKMREAC